jgi:hypothetical protein
MQQDKFFLWKRLSLHMHKHPYLLHFYCEADMPHLGPHPGYTVTMPRDSVEKYAQLIDLSLYLMNMVRIGSQLSTGMPTDVDTSQLAITHESIAALYKNTVELRKTIKRPSSLPCPGDDTLLQDFVGMAVYVLILMV